MLESLACYAAILSALAAVAGSIIVRYQLRAMEVDRRCADVSELVARVMDHNASLDDGARRTLEVQLGLQVEDPRAVGAPSLMQHVRDAYWNARLLRMRHVNLAWQAWTLHGSGERLSDLDTGWREWCLSQGKGLIEAASRLEHPDSVIRAIARADQDILLAIKAGEEIWPHAFTTWMLGQRVHGSASTKVAIRPVSRLVARSRS